VVPVPLPGLIEDLVIAITALVVEDHHGTAVPVEQVVTQAAVTLHPAMLAVAAALVMVVQPMGQEQAPATLAVTHPAPHVLLTAALQHLVTLQEATARQVMCLAVLQLLTLPDVLLQTTQALQVTQLQLQTITPGGV